MREGWTIRPLASVCEFKPVKAEVRQRLAGDAIVSFAPMEDLGIGKKFLAITSVRTLDSVVGSYTYFADGDVLLAKITPCFENGKLGVARNLVNGVGFGSSEFVVMRPGPQLAAEYLYYFLDREKFREEGAQRMTGAVGHKRVSKDFIENYPIPIPPIDEQHRIVAILDDAFEAIATAKANAEKNLRNAREVFDSRLREFFTGESAAQWPRKSLRQVAVDFGRGKSRHRPRNDPVLYGGAYPFIQTGDVRGANHIITAYTQTYSDAGLAQSKLWPRGTLCITIAANIAETGVLGFDACFPDSVIGVVVDEKQTSSKYIEYMLNTVKAALKAKGKGSAQDNINLGTFEKETFPFPDLETQTTITRTLDALATEISTLEDNYVRKLAALDELKQSLLHQAFNGAL